MKFTKMQGIGNDFIIINALEETIELADDALARKMCDRHYGIGGDGIMLILPSDCADIKMRIINSDGSEPEMCGNGIRCFARYVYEQKIVPKKVMTVETLAGIMIPELILNGAGQVEMVKVDMGQPILDKKNIPMAGDGSQTINETITVDGRDFAVTAVSMGNPHCVIFVEDIETAAIEQDGALIEQCVYFPQKVNVEFVQILSPDEVKMRVWERGAGITMACGTGACAVVVAGILNGKTARKVTVHLDGGDLVIEWQANTNHVLMTGAATTVFTGAID